MSDLVALYVGYHELRRRELVHQAFPGFAGTCWVVDRATKRVVWSFTTDDDENLPPTVLTDELPGQELLDRVFPPEDGDEPPPSFPMFHRGRLVQTAELNGYSLFDGHGYMVVAVSAMPNAGGELSRREREIVRLLLAGYTTINAAAILNVSESTIRTYVRRIYRKLEVTSRADLAQKCHFMNRAYGRRRAGEKMQPLAMRS